jgi:aspartyl-tRNA(Asn)/glutamyl-tRNA(Gln) amidotransferase subunit C
MSSQPEKIDVAHVAHLARLELTPAEQTQFAAQIRDILAHMAKLSTVPVDGVEPTAHAMPLQNVLRADEVQPSLDPAAVRRNAPEYQRDLFIVPKIVE